METPKAAKLFKDAADTMEERANSYGHPINNHRAIADMFTVYLARRFNLPAGDVTVTPRDVAMLNILQKVCRDANEIKDDNIVDIVGYAGCAAEVTPDEQPPILGECKLPVDTVCDDTINQVLVVTFKNLVVARQVGILRDLNNEEKEWIWKKLNEDERQHIRQYLHRVGTGPNVVVLPSSEFRYGDAQ